MLCRCLATAAAIVCVESLVAAQTSLTLTLENALQRAREGAAPIAVARARIAEAESAVADVIPRFHRNPVLDAQAGPRATAGRNTVDVTFGITQEFETGGQQRARRDIAQAGVQRRAAEADAVTRTVLLDVATLFLRGLAAAERVEIAETAVVTSRALLDASERRFALGDIAAIELNLVRLDAVRAAATLASLRADRTAAVGALRAFLRLPPADHIQLAGSLDGAAPVSLARLEPGIAARPDLTALAAETREAEAEMQLGRGLARPDVGLRAGYERDADDHIVVGGLTLTLPLFQKGQSTLAGGAARASRARLELDAARTGALTELRTSYEVFEQRTSAVTTAAAALPALADTDNLAGRSYDAGEMDLATLLRLRHDALETRQSLVTLRLDAMLERLRLDFIAGVLR